MQVKKLVKKPVPFGKYYLMDRIAVGGMAEVFKAKTFGVEGFEKNVALKRILPNIAEDQEFITMFIDEAKIAVQLSHANIAQIFELGEADGSYFIAMEFVAGKDLRTMFDRSRRPGGLPISPSQAAYVMARVCEGLDYAHRKRDKNGSPLNIVHRDISPQNILVSYEGHVKVIDFGVAKAQNKMGRTQAGILKGKFGYMSPEQVRGLPLDQRSDIFSLGIVLHEVLTNKRLFIGESDFHTLEKIRKAEAPPPSHINPQVPPRLDEIVMKALSPDVETRYQWASEMQEDLQRFIYTQSPVYAAKDLSQYMKQVFGQDMPKEKKRTSEYEDYFTNAPEETQPPAMNNATAGWDSHAHQQQRHGSGPSSFVGAPPPPPPNPSGFPQQTSSHSSHSGAYPTNQPPPQPPLPPQAGGFPNTYVNDDDDDPTMLGQDVASAFKPPPPPEPSMPSGPDSSPLTGEYLPGAQDNSYNLGGTHDEIEKIQGFSSDGEQDTIIDIGGIEESGPSKLKIILLGALIAIVLAGASFGLYMAFKGNGGPPPNPIVEEPGKVTFIFNVDTNDLQFLLNDAPMPAKDVQKVGSRRMMLIIRKEGKYTLQIKKPGYQTEKKRFKIQMDSTLSTLIKMKPMIAHLIIESNPKGAVVFIDGDRQATTTPGTYKVFSGKRSVRVLMQGHKPWEQVISLKRNERKTFKVKLPRTRASIELRCRAQGEAKIYLNNRRRGVLRSGKPWKKDRLSIKREYTVKIVPKDGSKAQEFKVSFPLDPYRKFIVNCQKPKEAQYGIIFVSSRPPAQIFIRGQNLGQTPKRIKLKVGRHRIVFTNNNTAKKRLEIPVSIKSGNNEPLALVKANWQ